MQNGKDTIANYLIEKFGNSWRRVAFATGVKRVYVETFDKDYDFIEEWKVKSESPDGFHKTVRQSLQFIGDGFREIKPDIWIELLFRKEKAPYIISDVRYLNEIRKVKQEGGLTILVWRKGFENSDPNGSEAQVKPIIDLFKQTDIDGPVPVDFFDKFMPIDAPASAIEAAKFIDVFIRNNGTKEDLYSKLDEKVIPYVAQKLS